MPSLTIKNIPEFLYDRLKRMAKLNHRSINSEVIACLERDLMPRRLSEEEIRERVRLHRERLAAQGFFLPDPETLNRWIDEDQK